MPPPRGILGPFFGAEGNRCRRALRPPAGGRRFLPARRQPWPARSRTPGPQLDRAGAPAAPVWQSRRIYRASGSRWGATRAWAAASRMRGSARCGVLPAGTPSPLPPGPGGPAGGQSSGRGQAACASIGPRRRGQNRRSALGGLSRRSGPGCARPRRWPAGGPAGRRGAGGCGRRRPRGWSGR